MRKQKTRIKHKNIQGKGKKALAPETTEYTKVSKEG